MKTWYAWATPSGPINLMKAEDMPVHPNNRVQVQRHEAEIRVIKDGEVVWQRDARADDYAWSNAENHAHHLRVKLMTEYEAALQAAKESSVPIQDQERAKKMIELLLYEKRKELTFQDISSLDVMANVIYGPFTVEYRLETINPCQPYKECQHPGENGWKCLHTCKLQHLVAILIRRYTREGRKPGNTA